MYVYMEECSNPQDELVDLFFSGKPVALKFGTTYREFVQKYATDGVLSVDCMLYIHFELVSRFDLWDRPAVIGLGNFNAPDLVRACYENRTLIPCNLHHKKITQNEEGFLYETASQWLIHNTVTDTYTGIHRSGTYTMSLEDWRQLMIRGIEKDAGLSDQMMELNSYPSHRRFEWLDDEYPGFRDKDKWFLGRISFALNGQSIDAAEVITNYADL